MAPTAPRRRAAALVALASLFLVALSLVPSASAASLLAIDYGTDSFKASLVKPGVPFDVLLTKEGRRKTQAIVTYRNDERFVGGDAESLVRPFSLRPARRSRPTQADHSTPARRPPASRKTRSTRPSSSSHTLPRTLKPSSTRPCTTSRRPPRPARPPPSPSAPAASAPPSPSRRPSPSSSSTPRSSQRTPRASPSATRSSPSPAGSPTRSAGPSWTPPTSPGSGLSASSTTAQPVRRLLPSLASVQLVDPFSSHADAPPRSQLPSTTPWAAPSPPRRPTTSSTTSARARSASRSSRSSRPSSPTRTRCPTRPR